MWRMGVGGKLIADLKMREWERLFGYIMACYSHIHTFRSFFVMLVVVKWISTAVTGHTALINAM